MMSTRAATLVDELRAQADVVIFDTPPMLSLPVASLLARHVDAVLVIVDASRSRTRQIQRAVELIEQAGGQVLGAAINRVRATDVPVDDAYVASQLTELEQPAPGKPVRKPAARKATGATPR